MGRRGKPENHKKSLEPWDSDATLALLRRVIDSKDRSTKSISEDISNNYAEYSGLFLDNPEFSEILENDFDINKSRLDTALRNNRWVDNILPKILFLYFCKEYPKLFRIIRKEHAEMPSNEFFVRSSTEIVYGHEVLNVAFARKLRGKYKLYRRSPFYPKEHIAVCELVIGKDRDPFFCSFSTGFSVEGHGKTTHMAVGKIVAPEVATNRFHALLGKEGNLFFFSFDSLSNESYGCDNIGGVMTASWGADSSSCWPIFAERIGRDERFSPHILDIEQFGTLPEGAQDRLIRGWVEWSPKRYLKNRKP